MRRVLCIVTAGGGGLDELRARRLSSGLLADTIIHIVDRSVPQVVEMKTIWKTICQYDWDLIYQEGTGILGGMASIRAKMLRGRPYLVSVGDPIGGFFKATKGPLIGQAMRVYEQVLYNKAAGIVGWTPYLTGAAMSMGAKFGITVEGAVDMDLFVQYPKGDRLQAKSELGLDPTHFVCGVVGSMRWNERRQYCYGLELIEVLKRVRRTDLSVLIVGDGTGRAHLEQRIPETLRSRAVFTGRLPEAEVVRAINAMDIGFVSQSIDSLGKFRLTTKLPEYLSCGLPVAMSPIPGYFDYVGPVGWRLPPFHPATSEFHSRCADWLDTVTVDEVCAKSKLCREVASERFCYIKARKKFSDFVDFLMEQHS